MGSKTKKSFTVLLAFIMSFSVTGCFDKREIDDLVNPIAIGFDKGSNHSVRMTLQIAIPTKVAVGGEGGGGAEVKNPCPIQPLKHRQFTPD